MTLSLDILNRLIVFDTVSNRSNLDLISYFEDFLRARQFWVHRIPDLTEEKAGLYAQIGPQTGGGILFSAHPMLFQWACSWRQRSSAADKWRSSSVG